MLWVESELLYGHVPRAELPGIGNILADLLSLSQHLSLKLYPGSLHFNPKPGSRIPNPSPPPSQKKTHKKQLKPLPKPPRPGTAFAEDVGGMPTLHRPELSPKKSPV